MYQAIPPGYTRKCILGYTHPGIYHHGILGYAPPGYTPLYTTLGTLLHCRSPYYTPSVLQRVYSDGALGSKKEKPVGRRLPRAS